jgi:hypothetical protein
MLTLSLALLTRVEDAADAARHEDGFSTAELLGNAALGVTALIVIWLALQDVGRDVISQIGSRIWGN